MATNGSVIHGSAEQAAAPSTIMDATNRSSSTSSLSKDEVGWYFVEQYYTTMSKSPEKLHLFYSKQSQFVYGLEAEVANVSVGRQAIQEQIKAQGFQDCKVRISNVDSQASKESIVIQVIGETSNKGGEPKKFVQTFVLAQQPSGYFVLNDILRYIDEAGDEETGETSAKESAPAKDEPATTTDETAAEPSKIEEPAQEKTPANLDAAVIDKKLEKVGETVKVATPIPAAITPVEPIPEAPTAKTEATQTSQDPEKTAREIADEDVKKPETPKDPSPTPVTSRAAAAPVAAEPEKPKGPPKPMTWANRAAAAAGPVKPVVPLPKTATPPAQARAAAPAVAAQPAAAAPAAAAAQAAEATSGASSSKDQDSDWQPAKGDTKRQNRPQSISGPQLEKEGTMAYIKYVTEKVKAEDLRAALAAYGELAYFDINRQKNCAFVEFMTQAGYAAAVAANPHNVNGESIIVEQRRPKANAYGGSNYSPARGGAAGRGRGGYDGNRAGSQGGARGGFTGQTRGRGGGGAARGARGTAQAANV